MTKPPCRSALTILLGGALLHATARAQTPPPAPPAPNAEEAEGEDVVVQATRSGRRVGDEPIRVELIDREEIEEKLLMAPGNIALLVAETGGLRVQVASTALGSANVRVRGLEGRYTQLLADGLPLYGGQASSIGLLQIPPTDLGRVEIIKGAASALYGPSALGGVINLVSRRPGDTAEADVLLNATSRDGQDATAYAATPLGGGWGASITGGAHRQRRRDLDGDGWIDMPGYRRVTLRPRLFWTGADGATLFATIGGMAEDRAGGTLPGRTVPDGSPFRQAQDSRRLDAGLVASVPVAGVGTVHLRASGMTQRHDHVFGETCENDRHRTLFGEASLAGGAAGTTWLAGVAYQLDDYRSAAFPAFDYRHAVPGMFGQVEHDLGDELTLAGSARTDFHNAYGTRVSPRLSLLYRPGRWTVRASAGRGFFAPTPFVDETEAAGLSRLAPLRGLRAEVADTGSLDIGWKRGATELTGSLFAASVDRAVRLVPTGPMTARLVNVDGPTRTWGMELLVRQRLHAVTLTGSYVHVHSTEPGADGSGRRAVPRTPRDTGGVVAMWEPAGRGRLGIEAYYTGRQELDDNPYRTRGRPYVELGVLGEVVVGRARLFLNAENILDVRQSRYDPIPRPTRAPDGRRAVDTWAPTDGFVLNGGVRLRLGG